MKDNDNNELEVKLVENNNIEKERESINNSKDSKDLKEENKKEEKDINIEINNNNTNNNTNDYYKNLMEKIVVNNNNNDLNRSFGQVIEDDIKRTETAAELKNIKKKKIEDENEGISYDDTKKQKKTKFLFHTVLNKNFLRFSTLITIILYIIVLITSCVIFHLRREKNPFLFCFKFIDRIPKMQDLEQKDLIYFLTDLNSFYIIHVIFLSLFISVSILMIKGSESERDHFFDNMAIFFMFALLFNIPIFFMGMFTEFFYGNILQPIIYLILTLLSFLCMGKIYLITRSHEYKNGIRFFNISVLASLMTAYQCYCFLFNLNYFIMNFYKPQIGDDDEYPGIEIAFNCIYLIIGLVIIFVYRDIFFNGAMVNIQIGFLYAKRVSNYLLETTIVNIAVISLNYATIFIVIFWKKKSVFRLKDKKNKN